jgi:predicted RNA methylase
LAPLLDAVDASGEAHLATLKPTQRRRNGCYYTPARLAWQLVKVALAALPGDRPLEACDPAAGAGAFVVPLAAELARRPGSRIAFADRDEVAVALTSRLLARLKRRPQLEALTGDSLAPRAAIWGHRYDLVIGNPPFAAGRRRVAPGLPGNLAASFVARSVAALSPGGVLCFVLPRPLDYVDRWKPVRELLWREGRLEQAVEIHRTIDVGMEQVALLFRRMAAPRGHLVRVSRAAPQALGGGLHETHRVPAELSSRGPTLAISHDPLARRVIAAIERRSSPLGGWHPQIWRGLALQRHIQPNVGQSGGPRGPPGRRWLGRADIDHYRLGPGGWLPAEIERDHAQAAQRQHGVKILAQRRVARRVHPTPHLVTCAALDEAGELRAVDTTLIVKLADPEARLLLLLALNSDLGAYFLEKVAFDGNVRTTPDLDRSYLLRFFVPDAQGALRVRLLAAARQGDREGAERLLLEHFEIEPRLAARLSAGRQPSPVRTA